MFMLRSLYDKVVGPTSAKAELANVEGCFYLVRPTVTVKGSKQCLFQTAIAAIRRTSVPYQYELVIQRSVSKEEADLLGEEAETLEEYVSLIDGNMRFAVSPANPADSDVAGAKALTWLDLTVEEEDSYLLVVEGVSDDELGDFELTMHKCMWERDNMTDSAGAPAAELRAYKVVKQPSPAARSPQRSSPSSKKASPVSTKKPLFRAPSPSSSEDEIADELTKQINKLQVSQAAPALVSKASPKTGRTSKIATSPPRQTLPPKSEAPVASSSKGKGKAVEYDPEGTIEPLYGSSRIAAHDTSSREAARKSKTASKVEAPPEPESDLPTRADVAAMIRDPPDEKRLILAESCELHVFDSATLMFMSQANNTLSSLWLVQRKDCNCWLSVTGEDGTFWISQGIDSSTEVSFQEEHRSVIFTVDDASGRGWTWLLKYPDLEQYNRVNNAFQVGIFEAKNGFGSWDKLKPEDQQYNRDAWTGDVEMEDVEHYVEDEDEQAQYAEEEEEAYAQEEAEAAESEEETEESDDESESGRPSGRAKNSLLAVGHKGLSFVVRGDMIGVFENQKGTGKKMKFMTNISGISRPGKSTTFTPDKVMLHDQDMTMVISDPMDSHSLYRLDLTTGKVIEQWKVSDDIDVKTFLPDSKFAQTTGVQTFIGTSHNALFRIDPRLGGNKLVESQHKSYVSKNDFSAATTTESGHIAVASNKGEIRLFDSIGKNAKTALPAVGDGIIGIDVTADGQYLIATCRKYILFLDTTIQSGRYTGSQGFTRSFPADAKPRPRRLELKPEHRAYIGSQTANADFTPAKFNTTPGGLEKTIVTSVGPFVVIWNLRKVKAGQSADYKLQRHDAAIVSDAFRFGDDREIIVTLPDDMRMESKSQMQNPTRQSLVGGTPMKSKIRRSDIVQQWDDQ